MTTDAPSLQYAPPLPRHKRRSFRRGVWLCLLLLLGFGVWSAWPWAWYQLRFWHWQRQCAAYAAPAEQVISEEAASWGGVRPPFVLSADPPEPLVQMERLAASQSVRPYGPVVYLHERQTPSGQRRVIVVRRVPPAQRQSWMRRSGYTSHSGGSGRCSLRTSA